MKHLLSKLSSLEPRRAREQLLALPHQSLKERLGVTSPKLPRLPLVEDTTINGIPVRIYSRKKTENGVIVYLHGDGFSGGSLDTYDQLMRLLCKHTNHTVISVNYSLAPKTKHPAPIEEVAVVLESLAPLAETYFFNSSDITLMGDSVGGFIALYAAQNPPAEVARLVLLYPSVKPYAKNKSMSEYAENQFLSATRMAKLWRTYLGSASLPVHSEKWLETLPPTLIITAGIDILRDEAKELHNKLRNSGKPSQYKCFKQMWHGFMLVPSPVSDRIKAIKVIKQFLNVY